jgi:hypothetical protein
MMKKNSILLALFLAFAAFGSAWFGESGGARVRLTPSESGEVTLKGGADGGTLVYQKKDRTKFRMTKEEWNREKLVFEVKFTSDTVRELRGCAFVKDKDGWWFQDPNEFRIIPDEWQRIELNITPEHSPLMPIGHQGAWSGYFAAARLTAGLSIYGAGGEYTLLCREPKPEGVRPEPVLAIQHWDLPESTPCNDVMQSTFRLTKEFFNPFDPDEITVDYEVRMPDGQMRRFPAFYTIDYSRRRHFTAEINAPVGRPYWAFRFTPEAPGVYEFRVVASEPGGASAVTPWRKAEASVSSNRGFVRVGPDNHRLMFGGNGTLFYPVGINIHTNVDLRSEYDFDFGHLPDQGTYDYDAYFEQMTQNGINAVEIWMAAWGLAIEWNSSRQYYHGLGRYNLCNAWRLDHVLANARSKNIYVHLTLDNHTKLTHLEWGDNPFNTANAFGVANGAFLTNTNDFFTNETARRLNRQRNRYIAARWGAEPAIFGVELWSEIDLVPNFQTLYDNDALVNWHTEAASEFRVMDQGRHLLTTHYCGDYNRLLRWYKLITLPVFDYVAGDAYRNPARVHFIDLIQNHARSVKYFERPVLITEFGGGSSGAGQAGYRLGDIHSANWLGLFLNLSASPFTWWHDFVHINNYYPHYRGFADFIGTIDLTAPYDYAPLSVGKRTDWLNRPRRYHERRMLNLILTTTQPRSHLDVEYNYTGLPVGRNYVIQGLSMSRSNFMAGWIFSREHMHSYPPPEKWLQPFTDYVIQLDKNLKPGRYLVTFFDTVTNRILDRRPVEIRKPGEEILVPVPAFQIDTAFKVEAQP